MAEMRGGKPVSASQKPTGGDKAFGAGGKKQFFRRRKVCRFCVDKIDDINYKDVRLLAAFISERGKIRARRVTGNCVQHQRDIAIAVSKVRRRRHDFQKYPGVRLQRQQFRKAARQPKARDRSAMAQAPELLKAGVKVIDLAARFSPAELDGKVLRVGKHQFRKLKA